MKAPGIVFSSLYKREHRRAFFKIRTGHDFSAGSPKFSGDLAFPPIAGKRKGVWGTQELVELLQFQRTEVGEFSSCGLVKTKGTDFFFFHYFILAAVYSSVSQKKKQFLFPLDPGRWGGAEAKRTRMSEPEAPTAARFGFVVFFVCDCWHQMHVHSCH